MRHFFAQATFTQEFINAPQRRVLPVFPVRAHAATCIIWCPRSRRCRSVMETLGFGNKGTKRCDRETASDAPGSYD